MECSRRKGLVVALPRLGIMTPSVVQLVLHEVKQVSSVQSQGHFTLELEGLRDHGTKDVQMDEKPTWILTWHAMDSVL